ncbi:addiction module [Commensalibacter intestini A911]|uniref:Addiction module antitoxin n=2 Tax=Commensalibacter intestini TaxID=479936 RepID=A0A251ZTK9_9PROT|nr:addiction module antitoxin [Commensalibacter intestini]EHD13505.1 addiction module [Commensalibacter intestini A911]OUI77994.1 addiction module antitoxin [Commensalibacter intestini]
MKTDVMTFKVEAELKENFKTIAARNDRPAAQVIRELMREYISKNREPNELTLETMRKSERGEDLHTAKDINDLYKQLGI